MVLSKPKVILGSWQRVRLPLGFLMSNLVIVKTHGKLKLVSDQPARISGEKMHSSCLQNEKAQSIAVLIQSELLQRSWLDQHFYPPENH